MNIPYVMRQCTKCGKWLVASTVNFSRAKKGRYGLEARCKECERKRKKQWHEDNPEYHKQWYETNPEYNKQYYEANLEYYKQYNKQYYQSPQGQVAMFNNYQRRRAKEEQQGDGITKDQWLEMMKFFDFRCAYSGEVLSKKTRSVDHIVPISTGGDNMIWNMVPMIRSLNCSKQDKDMEKWYKEQECYDPKRLQKIYEWQEYAYNKYGKDSLYFNSGNIQIKLL